MKQANNGSFQSSTLNSNLIRLYENQTSAYTSLNNNNHPSQRNFIPNPIEDIDEDDIDTALNKLEKTLDQVDLANRGAENRSSSLSLKDKKSHVDDSSISNTNKSEAIDTQGNNAQVEIEDYLLLLRNHKYSFRKFKPYYFVLDSSRYLSFFKNREEAKSQKPIQKIQLRACQVSPDVSLASRRFCITLKGDNMSGEMTLRFQNEESYANWTSAIKLASKNRSISDSIYDKEVKSISSLLSMQNEKKFATLTTKSETKDKTKDSLNLCSASQVTKSNQMIWLQSQAVNLMPIKMLKKFKLKYVSLVSTKKISCSIF